MRRNGLRIYLATRRADSRISPVVNMSRVETTGKSQFPQILRPSSVLVTSLGIIHATDYDSTDRSVAVATGTIRVG